MFEELTVWLSTWFPSLYFCCLHGPLLGKQEIVALLFPPLLWIGVYLAIKLPWKSRSLLFLNHSTFHFPNTNVTLLFQFWLRIKPLNPLTCMTVSLKNIFIYTRVTYNLKMCTVAVSSKFPFISILSHLVTIHWNCLKETTPMNDHNVKIKLEIRNLVCGKCTKE